MTERDENRSTPSTSSLSSTPSSLLSGPLPSPLLDEPKPKQRFTSYKECLRYMKNAVVEQSKPKTLQEELKSEADYYQSFFKIYSAVKLTEPRRSPQNTSMSEGEPIGLPPVEISTDKAKSDVGTTDEITKDTEKPKSREHTVIVVQTKEPPEQDDPKPSLPSVDVTTDKAISDLSSMNEATSDKEKPNSKEHTVINVQTKEPPEQGEPKSEETTPGLEESSGTEKPPKSSKSLTSAKRSSSTGKLMDASDVLVEAFLPGTSKRFGLL